MHSIVRRYCYMCFVVLDEHHPKKIYCPDCAAERERIRKLRWIYKRMATPARAKRYRDKKARAA